MILATPDNGLAAVLFNACSAKAKVGNGTEITLHEQTSYPFDETILFTVESSGEVVFPLYLRIPSWCDEASISVNGNILSGKFASGKYARLVRNWKNGDKVVLNLPMKFNVRRWQVNKNSVSVDYGPLTLSLEIKERYEKSNSRETAIGDSKWQEGANAAEWPAFEIYPDSPWNYALAADGPISVERREWNGIGNPFTLENIPLKFKAKGRIVPEWKIDEYGLCGVLPYENAKKSSRLDDIVLVPMGAARLRISAFPYTEK